MKQPAECCLGHVLSSPKIRIKKVDTSRPMVPVVRSARRIEMAELMTVLPNKSVQSNRFPCLRTAHIE